MTTTAKGVTPEMADDLIETPADLDQIATRIDGQYLDAPISCNRLYRSVADALMAERASKDAALSEMRTELNAAKADVETFWKPQFDEQCLRAEAAESQLEMARKALEDERGRNRKLHRRAQNAEALSQSTECLLADWAKVAKERKGGDINLLRFSIALDDIQRARKKIAARALAEGERKSKPSQE